MTLDTMEITLALKIGGAKDLEQVARGLQMAQYLKDIGDLRDEKAKLEEEIQELKYSKKPKAKDDS